MTLDLDDVISAVATPAGPAERSVIRMSGAGVVELLRPRFVTLVSPAWPHSTQARRHTGHYQIEGWRIPVPIDLWLWPTTRSYTGQPSAELHLIGSPPIVDAILEQLYCDGARPARAGEFTLRAFLAGRVDLVQAEAVLGVIDATDHEQLQTALTQLAGGLSRRIEEVRESLLLDLADLEAGLDFVEEDIEFVHREQMLGRIASSLELAEHLLEQNDDRMVSGSRPRVVLAGLPNAGKSTLFNRLIGEQRAIVSDQAGTTRDYLSAELNWHGLAIELIDTAGADSDSTGIAAQAEQLRQLQVGQADLVVWCSSLVATEGERGGDDSLCQAAHAKGADLLRVWTQRDTFSGLMPDGSMIPGKTRLLPSCEPGMTPAYGRGSVEASPSQTVSALTGEGIAALVAEVARRFTLQSAHRGEWLATTAARSRDSLQRCVDCLHSARSAAEQHLGDELLSIELRGALEALGEICGAVQTDDILDRIFSRFCIGK